MGRWTKGRQIPRLEVAARNIGNAHQFVELGEAYRETGKTDRAAECFKRALQKDPASMPALPAMSRIEVASKPPLAKRRAETDSSFARDMPHPITKHLYQTLVWSAAEG